jgi:hypothetical protein
MANAITKTVLHDGVRNLVVLVTIVGDGSGEETATVLINRSTYADTAGLKLAVNRVQGLIAGFSAQLLLDATTDLVVCALPDAEPFDFDWRKIGGVASAKAGAGYTGNLLITTSGLGAGDKGTFTLFMRKGGP